MKIYIGAFVLLINLFPLTANAAHRTSSYVFYIHIDAPENAMHDDTATAYWYTEGEVDDDSGAVLSPAACTQDSGDRTRYKDICNEDEVAKAGAIDFSWMCVNGQGCADDADIWLTGVSYDIVERSTNTTTSVSTLTPSASLSATQKNEYAEMNHHFIIQADWPGSSKASWYGAAPFGASTKYPGIAGSELTSYDLPTGSPNFGINLKDSILSMGTWHWSNPAEATVGLSGGVITEVLIKVTLDLTIEDYNWSTWADDWDTDYPPVTSYGSAAGTALTEVDTLLSIGHLKMVIGDNTSSYVYSTDSTPSQDLDLILGLPHVHDHATDYTLAIAPTAGGSNVVSISDSPNNSSTWKVGHELYDKVMSVAHDAIMCMSGGGSMATCMPDIINAWGDHSSTSYGHLPLGGLDLWEPSAPYPSLTGSTSYTWTATVDFDSPHWYQHIDNMYLWVIFAADGS